MWSILDGIDLGITAHVVDHRIDAGKIISWDPLPLYKDDSVAEVGQRLIDYQTQILLESLNLLEQNKTITAKIPEHSLRRKMPPELEARALLEFSNYLNKRTT